MLKSFLNHFRDRHAVHHSAKRCDILIAHVRSVIVVTEQVAGG